MKTWLFGAAIAALMVSPALADHHEKGKRFAGKMHDKMMEKVDADGDGKVSKEEFIDAHTAKFEKMDADGDGFLTDEEMKAAWQAKHEKMRARKQELHEKHESKSEEASEAESAE